MIKHSTYEFNVDKTLLRGKVGGQAGHLESEFTATNKQRDTSAQWHKWIMAVHDDIVVVDKNLLTLNQIESQFGISRSSIQARHLKGKLISHKLYFDKAEIEELKLNLERKRV
jgi:hypothetical protein